MSGIQVGTKVRVTSSMYRDADLPVGTVAPVCRMVSGGGVTLYYLQGRENGWDDTLGGFIGRGDDEWPFYAHELEVVE